MRRRDSLQIGALAGCCWAAPSLELSADDPTRQVVGRAKNCILIWLDGGPSHLETFDVKPQAPKEVRGPLEAISTSVPGVSLGECFPETAKLMQHLAIVRSVTSPLGEHNLGTHYLLSGYPPSPVLQYPSFHAVAGHLTGPSKSQPRRLLPVNVAVPNYRVGGQGFSGSGYLPSESQPFVVGSDPASADFRVRDLALRQGLTLESLQRRRAFTDRIRQLRTAVDGTSAVQDESLLRAFDLLTSGDALSAFALHEEPASVRNRYGRRTIGQSCLLARRLIEKGVPFITVNNVGWDTHADLHRNLKEGFAGARPPVGLIPLLDQALSALLQDLEARGLLQETLVLVMGEFGRTPKLNAAGGRDHWPRVFSVALAGGGVRGGQVYGESDRTGEVPFSDPVTPADLVFTVYSLLGIDPFAELRTNDGRPVRLTPPEARFVPLV